MFFRPILQFFSFFLLQCLPLPEKRRFGAFLRAKNTRFSVNWDIWLLTEKCTMQNAKCKGHNDFSSHTSLSAVASQFCILNFELSFAYIPQYLVLCGKPNHNARKKPEKIRILWEFSLDFCGQGVV